MNGNRARYVKEPAELRSGNLAAVDAGQKIAATRRIREQYRVFALTTGIAQLGEDYDEPSYDELRDMWYEEIDKARLR